MKATILEITGPEEGNIFEVKLQIEKGSNVFGDTLRCVALQNIEPTVKRFLEDLIEIEKLTGKTIKVEE